jgi:hypothetical protein
VTDKHRDPRAHMIVETDGIVIRKIGFELDTGERFTARDPSATAFQREDGAWCVGWGVGAAGPFESSQLAQAVATAMRGEMAPT